MVFIETPRIMLRQWHSDDLSTFIGMCRDSRVMRYFPKRLNSEETKQRVDYFYESIKSKGYGFWAAEYKSNGAFIGFVGLNDLNQEHPKWPEVEIGWRLHPNYWRQGLASEAAEACLKFAFTHLGFTDVMSQTPVINKASIGVMQRIGMQDAKENFNHPLLELGSELSEHVTYRISREQWLSVSGLGD